MHILDILTLEVTSGAKFCPADQGKNIPGPILVSEWGHHVSELFLYLVKQTENDGIFVK